MRMWYSLPVALGMILPAACYNSTSTSTAQLPPFAMLLQPVITTGLSSPIDLQAPPGHSRLFIAERPGRIRVVQGSVPQTTPFLDISSRVTSNHGEAGLLSFAFHPQYLTDPQKQFVFVHFIEPTGNINGDIVVERYQVSSSNPNLLDVSSVQPVIRIPHRDFDGGLRVDRGQPGVADRKVMSVSYSRSCRFRLLATFRQAPAPSAGAARAWSIPISAHAFRKSAASPMDTSLASASAPTRAPSAVRIAVIFK